MLLAVLWLNHFCSSMVLITQNILRIGVDAVLGEVPPLAQFLLDYTCQPTLGNL